MLHPLPTRYGTSRVTSSSSSSFCRDLWVGDFKLTLLTQQTNMVMRLLSHVNSKVDPGGCCVLHQYLRNHMGLIKKMLARPCRTCWRPMSGWQCEHCLSLNSIK